MEKKWDDLDVLQVLLCNFRGLCDDVSVTGCV